MGEIQGSSSGIGGGRFLWALEGSHLMLPPSSFSTSFTKILSSPQLLHFPAAPSRVHRTWSLRSCRPGHCVCPSSCHSSFSGGHTSPHATPQNSTGGTKWIYQCQVEGCKEGPSTSLAAVCAHVREVYLGGEVGVLPLWQDLFQPACLEAPQEDSQLNYNIRLGVV